MPSYILRCVHSKNRNCFLGINPRTFNNNIRHALEFKVSIVKLNLGNDQFLYFSTFADYTLNEGQFSLNGFFAMKINIQKDRFYEIDEQNESVECRSVTFCPVSVDDWEILQNNTEITEEVFLNQIRILSLHMSFPIWISGLCILLRVVQIEPCDNIPFSVISSSTRVTVIPEFREQSIIQPEPTSSSSSLPANIDIKNSLSLKNLVRSIGTFVYSSLPNSPMKIFNESEKKSIDVQTKSKLALVPGRNRRIYRVEIDETTLINPTIARINRSDWSLNDDDGTGWPDIFVAKVTVYRSSKEIKSLTLDSTASTILPEHISKIYFLLIQLTNDNICRQKHIKLNQTFASLNCIRSTDKLIVCNTTRPPRNQTKIEFISNQWYGPTLLLQHYFHNWIRKYLNNDQPILITDGCFIKFDNICYNIHLTSEDQPIINDNPIYIAINEETIGQHTITVDERKEWNFNEIEIFRSTPIVESFINQQEPSLALINNVDRLLQILELQLQIDLKKSSWNNYLLKNVIITGRSGSGKKTIIGECCQRLWNKHLIYYKFVDCLSFKGRKLDNIITSISQIIDELIFRQPSILILDHFDDLFTNETTITDANIILATQKLSLSVRELFHRTQQIHTQFIIISIAKHITNIHRQFTEETPLFYSQILTIEPLNTTQRTSIIKQLIENKKQTITESLLHYIVNRTESFVIKDLYTLIDNALLHSWMSFEDRQLSNIDFDYAFNEFKPINVKLLDDDTKKSNRTILHWSDIGGMDDLKQELIQTVQWRFQHSNYFSNAPIRLISGVLLYGPSGCGKTLVAQTLANECKVNFLQVKGPELLNKYVGSSEQNIRDLFNRARSVTPCIILFDEFEALVPRRGRDSAGVTDRVVNQLLTELDGVESLGDIVVIAATSRPDLIDPALLRPGRLDKHLYIGFPTKSDIISILKIWTKKIHLSDDIKFDDETIISHCEMYTGADIKALTYNAQLAAFEEYQTKQAIIIHKHHFISAMKQTPYSIPVHMRNANEHFYRNWRKPIAIHQQTTSLA
ncbi:unnamed protein product [Rotaria sordida]|uniref:Peroxisomal ATPase PEX1 n=1 Tax=Rotaria sordida TaxID=392033 RepID=A0A818NB89_9BILA|nr:unnamed protein product [Rotaria sordida]